MRLSTLGVSSGCAAVGHTESARARITSTDRPSAGHDVDFLIVLQRDGAVVGALQRF